MTNRESLEAAEPSPEARRASDTKYNQFWWRLMFELAILAMFCIYFVFASK